MSGLRDRSLMLMNYLFPVAFALLAGGLMSKINPEFTKTMIPALIVFALMSSYCLGMPGALVTAREAGVLRSYRISGVPGWAALIMPVASNVLHMAIVSALIGVVSSVVFGAPLPGTPGRFALGWLLALSSLASLGSLIAVLSSSGRASILMAQIVFIPSIILGGLMTPADILPPALSRFALILPATHAMRIFRGTQGWQISAVVLATAAIAGFACASLLYEWDPTNRGPRLRRFASIVAIAPYIVSLTFM